jgi:hypothetical protein
VRPREMIPRVKATNKGNMASYLLLPTATPRPRSTRPARIGETDVLPGPHLPGEEHLANGFDSRWTVA